MTSSPDLSDQQATPIVILRVLADHEREQKENVIDQPNVKQMSNIKRFAQTLLVLQISANEQVIKYKYLVFRDGIILLI